MLGFFVDLGVLIRRQPLEIVIAVDELDRGIDRAEKAARKRGLIYTAASRLDNIVKGTTGKHVGQAPLFLDPEDDQIMLSEAGGARRRGFIADVGIKYLAEAPLRGACVYPTLDLEYIANGVT